MLGEPPQTEYDLNWTLFDIPIRIHPLFWLIIFLLGCSGLNGTGSENFASMLAWVLACLISIIVHELGHALTGKKYGSSGVYIVLHGMGGLAINARGRSRFQRIMVIAAGPGAGLLLYALFLGIDHIGSVSNAPIFANFFVIAFIRDMLWINLVWSILNLIPVFPLDGGQIMGQIICIPKKGKMFGNDSRGMLRTFKVSMIIAIAVACFALTKDDIFIAVMFGYFAYMNYQYMNQYRW
ncbi:MAG: M50 family metallopeptidase [Lentisphaeria bacterium]|nr:M50 family metallopeptidase [Lentisphaeria bacterium]NQZ69599.1 M50 family metallopeptidase [Lentisphaeria bacterium]